MPVVGRAPWILLLALGVLGARGGMAAPPGPTAEEFLRQVEQRHERLRSLTASFVQTYRSAATGQSLEERGRIFVKRPGRMRWDYREPDRKVFVVEPDGRTLSYLPADMRAVRSRIPPDAPHLRLLMGESDLNASFSVADVELKQPRFPGSRQLKLRPRQPLPGIEVLYLEADPRTHAIHRVLVVDALQNESDLVLDKVKEDAGVGDDVFRLRLPAGIDVEDLDAPGAP